MWSDSVFQAMQTLSKSNAVVASFTASGDIRRRLVCGFSIEKRPGFGKKRECIRGQLTQAKSNAPRPHRGTWPNHARALIERRDYAGIAGAQVAHSCKRGAKSSFLTPNRSPAAAPASRKHHLPMCPTNLEIIDFAGLSFVHATDAYAQMVRDEQLTPDTDIG